MNLAKLAKKYLTETPFFTYAVTDDGIIGKILITPTWIFRNALKNLRENTPTLTGVFAASTIDDASNPTNVSFPGPVNETRGYLEDCLAKTENVEVTFPIVINEGEEYPVNPGVVYDFERSAGTINAAAVALSGFSSIEEEDVNTPLVVEEEDVS